MKVLLLAGGFGTRFSEETDLKPKPMVEINGKPILWHIMKIYSYYGFNDFVILLGYKGYVIKEYFANYYLHQSDVTLDLKNDRIEIINSSTEPWRVTLLDTGINTMTGGRILRAKKIIKNEVFMLTYGDGVGDINIKKLLDFHKNHKKYLTLTSAQPDARFGALEIDENNKVINFKEKPKGDGSWINAGFFVCNPEVLSYIKNGDESIFEQEPLVSLSKEGQIYTYKHDSFWMPMDTLRDKNILNNLVKDNSAPWIKW